MTQIRLLCRAGRAALWSGICIGCVYGCRRQDATAPTPPTPAATAAAPPTAPSTRPASALWINGVAFRFPPATLVLSPQGQGMSAILCSDDPPAAARAGYRGNSFMIQMKLDVDSPDDLNGFVWRTAVNTTADVQSGSGIFLGGGACQLEPTSLTVTFRQRGADLIADLDGQFQSIDTQNSAARRQPATATGRLYTRVIEQN